MSSASPLSLRALQSEPTFAPFTYSPRYLDERLTASLASRVTTRLDAIGEKRSRHEHEVTARERRKPRGWQEVAVRRDTRPVCVRGGTREAGQREKEGETREVKRTLPPPPLVVGSLSRASPWSQSERCRKGKTLSPRAKAKHRKSLKRAGTFDAERCGGSSFSSGTPCRRREDTPRRCVLSVRSSDQRPTWKEN